MQMVAKFSALLHANGSLNDAGPVARLDDGGSGGAKGLDCLMWRRRTDVGGSLGQLGGCGSPCQLSGRGSQLALGDSRLS